MDTKPLTISSWPKAILHLDADVPKRLRGLFKGENKRQRMGLPVLHIKV